MMQKTPVTYTSLSVPPTTAGNSTSSTIVSGKGTLVTSLADRHDKIANISFRELPNEVLALIMRKVNDAKSILKLRATCQRFNAIYQDKDLYKTHERQYYIITANMATPTLCQILNSRLTTTVPHPGTNEWGNLQAYPLNIRLTGEGRQTALLKKAYLSTWELLLQPEVLNNRAQSAELMKILLDLSPHVKNTETYAAVLFDNGLSWQIFAQLADNHLDRCIQLVAKHFPIGRDSPAYEFIVTQLPAALENILELANDLKMGYVNSILLYVLGSSGHELGTYQARLELLDMLFKRGCDVNQTDQHGHVILNCLLNGLYTEYGKVAVEEDLSILQVLLQHPQLDVNARSENGLSALDWAINQEDLAVVQALLQHPRIKVNARNKDGKSALDNAIHYGNLAILYTLLQHPKINVNAKNIHGKAPLDSALDRAIQRGNLTFLQTLLQHPQIDVNAKDTWGDSALHRAVGEKNVALVQALLQHPQIDVNTRNREGKSTLSNAIERGDLAILQALLQYPKINVNTIDKDKTSLLDKAIKKGDSAIVQALLQHPQIDVNARGDNGLSALDWAINQEDLGVLQVLLQHPKIDVNARDREGKSTLDKAINKGNLAIVQALLQHPQIDVNARESTQGIQGGWFQHLKSDVNARNREGKSTLDKAIQQGDLAIIQALLQHPKIDVNAREGTQGFNALDWAINEENLLLLDILLQHPQTDVNACYYKKDSALYFAIKHNVLYIAQVLLTPGYSTLEASDSMLHSKFSAFNYCIWKGKDEMANLFLQNMRGQEKRAFIRQARALAVKKDHTEIVAILHEKYNA